MGQKTEAEPAVIFGLFGGQHQEHRIAVQKRLDRALSLRPLLVVDLARASYCDSTGLQTLIPTHRACTAADAVLKLNLATAPEGARQTLAMTGVDAYVRIFPGREAATRAGA